MNLERISKEEKEKGTDCKKNYSSIEWKIFGNF